MEWEKIVEDNINLVWKVLSEMNLLNKRETEDLFQIGSMGLMYGAKNYNRLYDKKKAQFSTFLYYCIKHEICKYFQYWNRLGRKPQIPNVSLYKEIGEELTIEDTLESPGMEEELNYIFTKERLMWAVDHILNEKQRITIIYRYGLINDKQLTDREIGEMLGCTKQRIYQIEKTSINKLKWFFKKYHQEAFVLKNKEMVNGILK